MEIDKLLEAIKLGKVTIEEAKQQIAEHINTPQNRVEDLGFAQLDIDREQRTGFPEVVFGEGKTAEQIITIFQSLIKHTERVIATRVDPEKANKIVSQLNQVTYHPLARSLTWFNKPILRVYDGYIAIVCAGSSDVPVAEEAALIAECMGSHVERVYDVGVAGIHRLFKKLPIIRGANAIIIVAGMEGALASVIGGLVSKPIVAVPTSIGYGASFQGVAPLLTMLNSCSPGISVVNIDNGFGAGYYAGLINKNRL